MKVKIHTRGFTLIEILIVIAIIGVLAAIILASLGIAKERGNDAKVQEQMNSLRNAAETYFNTHNNYGTAGDGNDCATGDMTTDTTAGFSNVVAASNWPDGNSPTCVNDSTVSTDATAYAAWHVLSDAVTYWCVDSTGVSRSESSAPASTDTACP